MWPGLFRAQTRPLALASAIGTGFASHISRPPSKFHWFGNPAHRPGLFTLVSKPSHVKAKAATGTLVPVTAFGESGLTGEPGLRGR